MGFKSQHAVLFPGSKGPLKIQKCHSYRKTRRSPVGLHYVSLRMTKVDIELHSVLRNHFDHLSAFSIMTSPASTIETSVVLND